MLNGGYAVERSIPVVGIIQIGGAGKIFEQKGDKYESR